MRALTLQPGIAGSARLDDIPEPSPHDGAVLAAGLALGICGTDTEIVEGQYGWSPPGRERLVLGHESLGRVIEAPDGSGFAAGDLVVGIVRHRDPLPCPACAAGEWDMCRNGGYTERGIKEIDGFGAELWRSDPEYLVRIDPALGDLGVLLEPASVVAKAWEHIDRIGGRAFWQPERVLVTGAGPVGLLAALLGAQRGLEVHVLDRATGGPKPALVRDLGATYHTGPLDALGFAPDIVVECTGAAQLVLDAVRVNAPGGIVCLAGLSSGGRDLDIDMAEINRTMVLENDVVFGTVNANRRHYETAAEALVRADRDWLGRLITRRVPLSHWQEALHRHDDDVKVVIDLTA